MGTSLHVQTRATVLLVALMILSVKGASALECHSCLDLGDGGCSPERIKKLTCPSSVHVCMETVAAVEWSHGKFSIGEKGCGLGEPGTNDKAVDVHGILAFSQLHQCNTSLCNTKLDIKALELQTIGNESARVPNGVQCYSCVGDDCAIDNSSVVQCYDHFQGCFHGNVTMQRGNFSLTRPLKGCVDDGDCTKVRKGGAAITLTGSCCLGSLCNVNLSNKTHFATSIPRLAFLPRQETNVTTAAATLTTPSPYVQIDATPAAGPAVSTDSKQARFVAMTSSVYNPPEDHELVHNHDHDLVHNHDETEIISIKDGTVKRQERKNQPSSETKGGVASLAASLLMTFLLLGLCL